MADIIDTVLFGTLYTMVGGLAIVFFWWASRFLRFKTVFIVRKVTQDRVLVVIDRAREVTYKGMKAFKLLKTRDYAPMPDDESIELTKRGKMFIEAYRTPTGEYYYLKDTKKFNINDRRLEPITTAQRGFYVHQMEKAHNRRMKKWSDMIMPIAGISAVVIIFVMLLVFWADVVKPFNEGIDKVTSMSKEQRETQLLLNEILTNKQYIRENATIPLTDGTPPPDVPELPKWLEG